MMGAVSRPSHPAVNHQETEAVPMVMQRALTTVAAFRNTNEALQFRSPKPKRAGGRAMTKFLVLFTTVLVVALAGAAAAAFATGSLAKRR